MSRSPCHPCSLRTRQDLDVVVSELDSRSYELAHKEDLLAQVSVDLVDRQKRAAALAVNVSEAQVWRGSRKRGGL